MSERKDCWTSDHDTTLASIVIRNISNGGTQLAAFEEVGEVLNRTPQACGFRWNSEVRKHYEAEIKEAKAKRNNLKGSRISYMPHHPPQTLTIDTVIDSLQRIFNDMRAELTAKEEVISDLRSRLEELQNAPAEFHLTEDYKALLRILERARQYGLTDPFEGRQIKLESDGTLEQIG